MKGEAVPRLNRGRHDQSEAGNQEPGFLSVQANDLNTGKAQFCPNRVFVFDPDPIRFGIDLSFEPASLNPLDQRTGKLGLLRRIRRDRESDWLAARCGAGRRGPCEAYPAAD